MAATTTRARRLPTGRFAAALASIGGGGLNGSLGVGWADSARARAIGGPRLVGDALGPNADTVIEAAPALERLYGLNPLAAGRLVSVGGSYAFGLRARRHRGSWPAPGAASPRAGARGARGDGGLMDVGGYASVPEPLLRADVNGLGARDAFARDLTVLAISDTARASLLGRGGRLLDQPVYATAADCLGDVAAVRMVPAKLLLSIELGRAGDRDRGRGRPARSCACSASTPIASGRSRRRCGARSAPTRATPAPAPEWPTRSPPRR